MYTGFHSRKLNTSAQCAIFFQLFHPECGVSAIAPPHTHKGPCCGRYVQCPPWFTCLNTCSPAGGAVVEPLQSKASLKEVGCWRLCCEKLCLRPTFFSPSFSCIYCVFYFPIVFYAGYIYLPRDSHPLSMDIALQTAYNS